jgi:hypothetical protein
MPENTILQDSDKEQIALEYINSLEEIKTQKKLAVREREIQQIQQAIHSMNFTTKRDRVAGILNLYPDCRDSDLKLTLRYWELFQSDIYTKNSSVSPAILFKLERLTSIARIRAKIQNEYGLFLGSEETRHIRRQREEEVREEVLTDNAPPPIVQIFADETGKNENTVIVGSVWFLDMRKAANFQNLVNKFKLNNNFKAEFHFTDVSKSQVELYKSFIDLVSIHRDFISFRAIATARRGSARSIEDLVKKLYDLLITKGFSAEHSNGRVTLPRSLYLTVDQSDGLDAIAKAETFRDVNASLAHTYDNRATLVNIEEIDSKYSAAIQLADIVSGALNRRLNLANQDGYKTDLANYIIEKLGLMSEDGDAFEFISLE